MPTVRLSPLSVLAILALAAPPAAGAQGARGREARDTVRIPESATPPAGKCRVWMPGVPAAQQSAPTDCTTALRQRPANGVVIFGPAKRDLSPFDVRNAWGPAGTEATRRATARGDSGPATRAEREREARNARAREAAAARAREASTRQIPGTPREPAGRDATPARKSPPPPAKKPEKP